MCLPCPVPIPNLVQKVVGRLFLSYAITLLALHMLSVRTSSCLHFTWGQGEFTQLPGQQTCLPRVPVKLSVLAIGLGSSQSLESGCKPCPQSLPSSLDSLSIGITLMVVKIINYSVRQSNQIHVRLYTPRFSHKQNCYGNSLIIKLKLPLDVEGVIQPIRKLKTKIINIIL